MKKMSIFSAVVSLLALLISFTSYAQWEGVGEDHTPGGSNVPLCILEKDNYIFFGDLGDGVYRYDKSLNTWTHLVVSDINLIYDLVLFDGKIWCAVDGTGVFSSDDNGETWLDKNLGLTHWKVYTLTVCNNTLYCGTYHGGVFRYDNGTGMWSAVNTGFSYPPNVWYALELGTIGNIMYLYSIGIGMWYTTNFGEGWYPLNNMNYDGNAEVHDFIDHGGYLMIPADYLGVMRSSNGGQGWDFCNEGMTSQMSVKSMIATDEAVFVATSDSGVFMSKNNGDTWEMINLGFPWDYQSDRYATTYSMEVIGDYLYAGIWWNGLMRAKLSDCYSGVMTVPKNHKPVNTVLSQNRPNPFSGSTEISYEVIAGGPVSLKVYNLLGKELATMVDQIQPPGKYSVTFHRDLISDLPGCNILFYRLTDKSSVQSRMMILQQ